MSRYDQFYESISLIREELRRIENGARRLLALYGEAADSIDLTFIKKVEEHYAQLVDEVSRLYADIDEEYDRLTGLVDQAGTTTDKRFAYV